MKPGAITWLRRGFQAAFMLLFVWLFIETRSRGADELGPPVRLFLDFDPLVLITTLLASHKVPVAFWLSLSMLALAFVAGRAFCGWACPMGTLNNIVGHIGGGPHEQRFRLQWLKYAMLAFLLSAAAFSVNLSGLLDPISLLIRSLSLSIYPAINSAAGSFMGLLYEHGPSWLEAPNTALYDWLREGPLPFEQPHYRQSLFMGLLFLGILALNLVEQRFWCRHLCPLGALLGLCGRWAPVSRKVSEGCTECGACASVCQGGAWPDSRAAYKSAECCLCNNCDDICPEAAVRYGPRTAESTLMPLVADPARRRMLFAAAAGIAAVPLLRVGGTMSRKVEPSLVRPPGALPEDEFLSRCVRCGECMKVCITGGLQPTLAEAGAEGLWTPVLVPRMGYCEFRCTLCGQVCPTGAIKRLTMEEKMRARIGLAMIDQGRCLPWSHGRPCIVCEEVCPTPKKAIWFQEARVETRSGRLVRVKQPVVDIALCVGCGICETMCPVVDRPAIYVTSIGEDRNPQNRLLM